MINTTRGSPQHGLWWSRKRAGEYIPTVDLNAIKGVAESNGWATKPTTKSRLVCDATDVASSVLRYSLCSAVAWLREAGVAARGVVGWKVQAGLLAQLWNGIATECFVDGPLVLIIAAVCLPKLVCLLGAALTRLLWGFMWRARQAPAPHKTTFPCAGPKMKVT